MKKEKDRCKDCAEYGSEFCPECLEELEAQKKTTDDKPASEPKNAKP